MYWSKSFKNICFLSLIVFSLFKVCIHPSIAFYYICFALFDFSGAYFVFFNSDSYTAGLIKYREPYPFGVDPSWRGSRSELPFLNSLKMKMSILLGLTQMNLGLILSYFNAKYFKKSLDIRYVLFLFLSSLMFFLK